MPVAPCWFLRLESDSGCSCCWGHVGEQPGTTRAAAIPAPPPRPPASGLERINPGSPQSSIHHLAAELATCQPAATCASRRRQLPIPVIVAREHPTAPGEAWCASANRRLASGAVAAPAAARSAERACKGVRAAGKDRGTAVRSCPANRFAFTLHSLRRAFGEPIAQPRHFFVFQK
jgi:hypothetical protein